MSDIPPDLLAPPPGAIATSDSPGLPLGGPQWGIFDQSGKPIIAVDAVASIEYARDYHISDYPQEKGAFQSYNKVKVPFQAKVGFLIAEHRTDFLNAVENAVETLSLVKVVTPEIQYQSANLTHYGYRREARSGRTLIRVDVWAEEIRIVSGVTASNQQSTNAASPTQGGQDQTTPTTQNPPSATAADPTATPPTENNVGGGFSTVRNTETSFVTEPTTGVTVPVSDSTTTIPAGIPNSTGGGLSALSTPVSDVIIPSTVAGF